MGYLPGTHSGAFHRGAEGACALASFPLVGGSGDFLMHLLEPALGVGTPSFGRFPCSFTDAGVCVAIGD